MITLTHVQLSTIGTVCALIGYGIGLFAGWYYLGNRNNKNKNN